MDKASIVARIEKEPRYKRVMYNILEMCRTPQQLPGLVSQVAALPDMHAAAHKPMTVISWLVDEGALQDTYADEEGQGSAQSSGQETDLNSGQSSNQNADSSPSSSPSPNPRSRDNNTPSDSFIVMEITVEGAQALADHEKEHPLADLIAHDAERKPAYIKALQACMEPQTQAYMEKLLIDEPSTETPKKVYPAYILDRLENAEAIAWDEGWLITPAGKALLESEELEGGDTE